MEGGLGVLRALGGERAELCRNFGMDWVIHSLGLTLALALRR